MLVPSQRVAQVQLLGLASPSSPGRLAHPVWGSGGSSEEAEFANGFFYGAIDEAGGTFAGDDVAFIFPDFRTVLVGRFEGGHMREAKAARSELNAAHNAYYFIIFYYAVLGQSVVSAASSDWPSPGRETRSIGTRR